MLKKALEKLKSTQVAADTVTAGDPRTRPGREMMRREALQNLPVARKEFSTAFKKTGYVVFVTGPGADRFSDLASAEAETVTINYNQTTSSIRDVVKASVGGTREFGVTQFTIFLREARELGSKLGLSSLPTIRFEDSVPVPRDSDVDRVVDQYLLKLGPDFLSGAIEQEATRQAESLKCQSQVIPIVILGTPEDVAEQVGPLLMGGRHISVKALDTTDSDFVVKTFKSIRKSLKTAELPKEQQS